MRDIPPLFVLRHGQTEWNVAGRLQSRLDSSLTSKGRTQAAQQGNILARILPQDAVALCSPQGRARETAQIALSGLALEITFDQRLMEVDLGRWQGQYLSDLAHRIDMTPPLLWNFTAPQGEHLDDVIARIQAVLDTLTRPTVIVTHGVTSRVLMGLALNWPEERWADFSDAQGVVHVLEHGDCKTFTE